MAAAAAEALVYRTVTSTKSSCYGAFRGARNGRNVPPAAQPSTGGQNSGALLPGLRRHSPLYSVVDTPTGGYTTPPPVMAGSSAGALRSRATSHT